MGEDEANGKCSGCEERGRGGEEVMMAMWHWVWRRVRRMLYDWQFRQML